MVLFSKMQVFVHRSWFFKDVRECSLVHRKDFENRHRWVSAAGAGTAVLPSCPILSYPVLSCHEARKGRVATVSVSVSVSLCGLLRGKQPKEVLGRPLNPSPSPPAVPFLFFPLSLSLSFSLSYFWHVHEGDEMFYTPQQPRGGTPHGKVGTGFSFPPGGGGVGSSSGGSVYVTPRSTPRHMDGSGGLSADGGGGGGSRRGAYAHQVCCRRVPMGVVRWPD